MYPIGIRFVEIRNNELHNEAKCLDKEDNIDLNNTDKSVNAAKNYDKRLLSGFYLPTCSQPAGPAKV
ncbi:hypothetical protein GCM10027442_48710 [Emticicia fontis]